MKKAALALFLLFGTSVFPLSLSRDAHISVLTCGPGKNELYAAFGHSAFRVYDPENHLDLVYNYGVFDFSNPNFYTDFARGYLYYRLGTEPYENFILGYIQENRYVHEQVLNLSERETQKLYDFLTWNTEPENQKYLYDYYYNNCATKIRDVLLEVFDGAIVFNPNDDDLGESLRSLTRQYVSDFPWGELSIDLCLGMPIDREIPVYDYMFLPDFIESEFDKATFTYEGKNVPLVREKKVIFKVTKYRINRFSLTHPYLFSGGFLVLTLALTFWQLRTKRNLKMLDVPLFLLMGLLGVFLLALWIFTDHWAAAHNFNLMWALPLHLPMALMLIWKTPHRYFMWVFVINMSLLLFWPWLPQSLPRAMFPIIVALAVRAWMLSRKE